MSRHHHSFACSKLTRHNKKGLPLGQSLEMHKDPSL